MRSNGKFLGQTDCKMEKNQDLNQTNQELNQIMSEILILIQNGA